MCFDLVVQNERLRILRQAGDRESCVWTLRLQGMGGRHDLVLAMSLFASCIIVNSVALCMLIMCRLARRACLR